MIKIHCEHLSEFLKIYVLDIHVLPALLIPVAFTVVFPLYWLVICPAIWSEYPALFRPRTWLVGYWLVASTIWFVSLAVCLAHVRAQGRQHLPRIRGLCMASDRSTEDLWNEDQYLPDPPYLPSPSPPDITVSLNGIQPLKQDLEPKKEMDETWDYDYDRMDSPFVVNPCDTVKGYRQPHHHQWVRSSSERICHSNLLRSSTQSLTRKPRVRRSCSSLNTSGIGSDEDVCSYSRRSLPSSPMLFPNQKLGQFNGPSGGRRLSGTLPHGSNPSLRKFGGPSAKVYGSRSSLQAVRSYRPVRPVSKRYPPPKRLFPLRPPPPFHANRTFEPIRASQSSPTLTTLEKKNDGIGSLTDDEMKDLKAVCTGKILRKDSIVSDAKFDTLIASLQSLAMEIEKDFVDQNMTDFAAERAKTLPTITIETASE